MQVAASLLVDTTVESSLLLISTKTHLTQQPIGTSAGQAQARQLTERGHSTTGQQASCLRPDSLSPVTSGPRCGPLVGQDAAPPTSGQAPTPECPAACPGLREPAQASGPALPTRGQTPDSREPQLCSLHVSRPDLALGPAWPGPAHQQTDRSFRIHQAPYPTVSGSNPYGPSFNYLIVALGPPGSSNQTPGPSSACQEAGTNPRTQLHSLSSECATTPESSVP